MRVAMLNHNVVWRSTFFRCFYFARQLVRMGHEVTIVTISPHARGRPHFQQLDGVEVALMPDLLWGIGRTGWDLWDLVNRLVYIRGRRFDLIHAFDSRPVVIHPAVAQARRNRVPLVIDWCDWWGRGGVISQRKNPLLRYFFSPIETWYEEHFRTQADWSTTISQALARRAAALGVPEDSITVIPGGADLDFFRPILMSGARERLGLPAEAPIVAFAGFVHYDLGLVLDSYELVAGQLPGALLTLCGQPSPLTARWKEAHPELAGQVLERGVVPIAELPYHLAAADVLLVPLADSIANRGRWPNKIGEYLAMGKPVVTNPTGDSGDMFRRTGAGVLAPDNPVGFGQAIVDLLKNPDRRRFLGARSLEVARSELDYTILTRSLAEIYEGLCA
jgi:glycosyltransferase involved in cell wall biosynthesis